MTSSPKHRPSIASRIALVAMIVATASLVSVLESDASAAPDVVTAEISGAPAPNPLADRPLHVASWTSAGTAADKVRSSRPADAERLDLLASTPTARWLGEWSGDVRAAADSYVSEAARASATPVLVAYNIPKRDCGSYSGGGASSPDAYRRWIRDIAAGIGSRPAVVILEPDAVALSDCLDAADLSIRNELLSDAIGMLSANAGTAVYLDAGHANWLGADEAARRLRAAGVARARGVALNVSNFGRTSDQAAYAVALHDRLGIHAVIDTSRNGEGSNGSWCNPFGRAIGEFPTTEPPAPIVDAYLWVKVPGESDGTCNGGPPAGTFWVDYAVDLVDNAHAVN